MMDEEYLKKRKENAERDSAPWTRETSKLKDQKIRIKKGLYVGCEFLVQDWWQNVSGGKSWRNANTAPTLAYVHRVQYSALPQDEQVLFGVIVRRGAVLVHFTELDLPENRPAQSVQPNPADQFFDSRLVPMPKEYQAENSGSDGKIGPAEGDRKEQAPMRSTAKTKKKEKKKRTQSTTKKSRTRKATASKNSRKKNTRKIK